MCERKSGFTLLEILIVVAILGIVLSVVAIRYGGVSGGVDAQKTLQRAAQVEVFVGQLRLLDVPYSEIAGQLRVSEEFKDFTLGEKVIGSYTYIRDYLAPKTQGTHFCNSSEKAYKFLDALDGPGKTPVISSGVIANVSSTSDSIYCFNFTAVHAADRFSGIIVRVSDDNVWWCENTLRQVYFLTAESGQLRSKCPDRTTQGSGWTANARNNSLFLKRIHTVYETVTSLKY